jgi:hypothetical protein
MAIRSAMLGLALLAVAAFPAAAQTPPEEPQWTEFQSAERGFAVSFPGTPKSPKAPAEGQTLRPHYDSQGTVADATV